MPAASQDTFNTVQKYLSTIEQRYEKPIKLLRIEIDTSLGLWFSILCSQEQHDRLLQELQEDFHEETYSVQNRLFFTHLTEEAFLQKHKELFSIPTSAFPNSTDSTEEDDSFLFFGVFNEDLDKIRDCLP